MPRPGPDDDKQRQEQMQRMVRTGITYVIVGFIVLWLFQQFVLGPDAVSGSEIPYSEFRAKLADSEIVTAVIGANDIMGDMKTRMHRQRPPKGRNLRPPFRSPQRPTSRSGLSPAQHQAQFAMTP